MTWLLTIYWLAFGIGLVYVLLSGAIGALAHGVHGAGAGSGGHHELEIGHGGADSGTADLDGDSGLDSAHGELDHSSGEMHGHEVEHPSGEGQDVHGGEDKGESAVPSGQFADYSPFSMLSIMGTLSGFGAGGLIASHFGWMGPLSIGPAFLGGAAMAGLLWLVIGKLFYSLQGSSEAHVDEMIGLEAEVITPVEHEMSGEIAYILGGTRYTAPARLERPGRIPLRGTVRIRRVQGNMVYVEERRKLLD